MLASLDLDNEVDISPVSDNRNPWSEKQSVQRKCYENLLAILAENNNVLTEKLQTKDLPTCTFRASFIKDLKEVIYLEMTLFCWECKQIKHASYET